jgi:hypothetical protein
MVRPTMRGGGAVSLEGVMPEWFTFILENYGLMAAVVAYFLYRDAVRDKRQHDTIDHLQEEMRQTVFPIVKSNTEVIAYNTTSLDRNTETVERCMRLIEKNQ